MRICRFKINAHDAVRVGLWLSDTELLDLTAGGITSLEAVLESEAHKHVQYQAELLSKAVRHNPPRHKISELILCAPVESQEVWAAGVTYLRSKAARMEESEFSATAYDRVYVAERPEIFFKSLGEKVAATGETVGIRRDAKWSVPEPELALVINSQGTIVGYTIGNDMSSRDIEGENLLYLPQAKVYEHSCALGPWIFIGPSERAAREWQIRLTIRRNGEQVFAGETSVDQIKRKFTELAEFLFRSQKFPHGAILLTGTGIVPPDSFTLNAGDVVKIEISGIGTLENTVAIV